jgi:lipopolysaccharide assembly protein B
MNELVWFLVPVAALGGWIAARWGSGGTTGGPPHRFPGPDYLRGLDYLLNEQPDKAIDVFVQMLEVTADTFETHLALGNLFRKRGEVDRAIRVHRNLVARDSLSGDQRSDALLELGRDFQRAGLLDRAEELYSELLQRRDHMTQVLPLLLDIYQLEKDWESAIRIASRMEQVNNRPATIVIAQFLCEMAADARVRGETEKARELLEKALATHNDCARASLLLGDIEREAGHHETALKAYSRIDGQDRELLPEVFASLYACHRELGDADGMIEYLRECIPRYNGIAPVIVLADILAEQHRLNEACEFLTRHLARYPSVRGLAKYVDLRIAGCHADGSESLLMLKNLTDRLQKGKPAYLCRECGFTGKTLYWQCPGCRSWDTVRPIHDVEGKLGKFDRDESYPG